MEDTFHSGMSPRMSPIREDEDDRSEITIEDINELDNYVPASPVKKKRAKNVDYSAAVVYDSHDILHTIRSFTHKKLKTRTSTLPDSSSLLSLLLYIKQLNESVSTLLNFEKVDPIHNKHSHQILLFLTGFNKNVTKYLKNISIEKGAEHAAHANQDGIVTEVVPNYTNAILSPYHSHKTSISEHAAPPHLKSPDGSEQDDEDKEVDEEKDESGHTNLASEGKNSQILSNENAPKPVANEATDDIKADNDEEVEQKDDFKLEEKSVVEEIKRRNIDEKFNFFESYYILKQDTNYKLHSHQHYSGRLGLRNISRLQLLRLISNIATRKDDLAPHISHSSLMAMLRAVFFAKLNGKKFSNISYVRFKKILKLDDVDSSLERKHNVSFKIYNDVKKYFEKITLIKYDGNFRNFHSAEIEDYYQGKLYIDRKFYIMNEILYPTCEYEQMFKVDDEKATEDEIYDAQNYGDIYRIINDSAGPNDPSLLFKKIELECFDDLQSVLNEQYGLKIFDPNCQLYFGTEVDYNDDGDEVEYISSRLIMTEYKGSTLAEKIYDYAEENQYLSEYDIGSILHKILISMQTTHRKKVIHCDLKPDNMIINMQNVKTEEDKKNKHKKIGINLIDFGYCEVLKDCDFVIQKHLIKGTKGYIAPEIYTEYRYSKRSDIYAIGCIGFEMITGGTLPSDYDINGNYVEEDESDDRGSDDGDDSQPKVLDIDIERVLSLENKKRALDNRISSKLIKFVSRMCAYEYDGRYDTGNAVLVARKNWSQMRPPKKNRTAFF